MEFKIEIFQAWKVMEMDMVHGKSWKSHVILKNRKIISISINFCHSFIDDITYKIDNNNIFCTVQIYNNI